ncbi:exocyst complex component Sec5-domain-containing protein [Calycina marina]|uniref:Exocyst complex component SEC5 n=1 Tax=Calycina marina TaxID=1763456 RepID=A0A9P7ZCJ0_9HELO|nr:exocyst complex component Sec5-domain-containing protein [Calycina marina]
MTDYERTVLEHYQLSTAYPLEWPEEKDLSDGSDDENHHHDNQQSFKATAAQMAMRRSKSRFSALERVASDRRSFLPGSQKTGDGVENLVQRDEPDPLGNGDSVIRIVRALGLPIQDDTKLRNRFLLSSTTFSPALFLSQVHSTASNQELIDGLGVLSQSIDQKSASLKVLVESNFERFVRAKQTIDNVYAEMRYRGAEPTPAPRQHSRHTSKSSFRSGSQAGIVTAALDGRKKNALIKESEYGVLGIKAPLLDVSAKAEEVWGPAIGGREKEESLKVMATTVDRYKEFYEINGSIADAIKRKDYETLVDEYGKARRFAEDAKKLADDLGFTPPTESQIHKILLGARLWHDVEEQIEDFKREIWRKLIAMQNIASKDNEIGQDQHLELIGILLELGVNDNPIWVWLLSRYDYLKNKIQTNSERSRVEIEILRRRLANGDRPTPQMIVLHLRSLGRQTGDDKSASLDAAEIIELWEAMVSFLTNMLSTQGILGEVLEFWQTVQNFIEGKSQTALPKGLNNESERHHRLSDQGSADLTKGTVELVDMIRESVFSFFAEPPIEDISALFSPMLSTPQTPRTSGTTLMSLTPTALRSFNLDRNSLPSPSPKRGEAWERLAFWPPWSNSISGVHYLAKLLVLVGTGASEMASISRVGGSDETVTEALRALVGVSRERCVTAICAAWNKDAENIKVMEDWRRSPEKRDLTRMPAYFGSFESSILTGMQKILYIAEAKSGAKDVVAPPPAKLLQMVRSQFVTTLYKALSGMVENAEKSINKTEDDWTVESDGLASPVATVIATSIGAGTVNASDRNVRMLLTLSNLQALRVDVVPNLTSQFENAFSVKLTEETKTIRDVLGQIDTRLFQSYTRPAVQNLQMIIRNGISDPSWVSPPSEKSKEVRTYVYEALLSLVLVHTEVSTTANTLTNQVLSYLLEQCSRELLEAFKQRQRYSLAALVQATLDVEFVAQTLNQYTTERATDLQSQIYQELDRGTDDEARSNLQSELPGMRNVLKKLREGSRSQFACFRKLRTRGADRTVSDRGTPSTPV